MTDRKISNFEFATLNYFLTRAFLIGITFNALINALRHDSWIIPLVSIAPALIIIFLLDYIMKYKSNLNLSEKIISLFNRKIGIVIIIILTIFIFFISLLNFLNMSNFIQSQFLSKTPLLAICIMFMLTTFYIASKGINVISRTSNILFYLGFVLLLLSFIGLIGAFKIENLKPFFMSSIVSYSNGLNTFYAFNILPIFLLTMIPKDCLKSPNSRRTLIISYIVSAISIFFVVFQTIATLGYELTKLYEYPEFFVLKHIVLINLSFRVESILIIQLIFDMFIYNIISVYFIGNSIKSIFNTKKLNIIYFMVCTLITIGSLYISKYSFYLDDLIANHITTIISVFITLIILIICIKIKIDKY